MRAAILSTFLWPLTAAALAALTTASFSEAQQFQFVFGSPRPAELSAPQVDVIPGATAARLEQAKSLAEENNWQEAIDIYRELAGDDSGRLVQLDNRRYVRLPTYCHMQIARLPAAGLTVYRRLVDPMAEQWYREGLAARDEQALGRVADELFCSSWGDDALLALGELTLERGDYAAARRYWEQISPLLRDPAGRPVWLALRGIDLNANWPQVERRWFDQRNETDWLAFPDTELDLADVRARLILVSIRAGELDRAALELDVFRRLHPTAAGQLGGQEDPYAAALERLLSSARQWSDETRGADWPTFAGSQTRLPSAPQLGPILVPAWAQPVALAMPALVRVGSPLIVSRPLPAGLIPDAPQADTRAAERPLSCFPVVVNRTVVFADSSAIRCVDLATGKEAVTTNGLLYRNEPTENSEADTLVRGDARLAYGEPRFTLTAADGIVYGRVGALATTHVDARRDMPGDRLVGIDLARDGLLSFRTRSDDGEWSFDGAPVCDGRRVFGAIRRSDVSPRAYIACFDAATGTRLWRTAIGAADTPATGRGDEITHNLLTLVGKRIYFNSNLGLVAALDVDQGEICWLHRYDRLNPNGVDSDMGDSTSLQRDPSPCLHQDGILVVAPSDTPSIFALDAETGKRLWVNNQVRDAMHLLGVARDNLVVGGHRLRMLDVRSGDVQYVWPESEHAGIRGSGRGLVAGNEIFWPTRHEIYCLDATTGAQSRPPISLAELGDSGANLAAADGHLIAAGPDKLMAFGPSAARNPNPPKPSKTVATTTRPDPSTSEP